MSSGRPTAPRIRRQAEAVVVGRQATGSRSGRHRQRDGLAPAAAGRRIRAAWVARRAARASSNRNDGWKRGRSRARRVGGPHGAASGRSAGAVGPRSAPRAWAARSRLEIAVGDERLDRRGRPVRASGRSPVTAAGRRGRARRCAGRGGSGPGPRPRSDPGRRRSPRSTSRRRSAGSMARRRSSGSRPTADQAAATSSVALHGALRCRPRRRPIAAASSGASGCRRWRRRRSATALRAIWKSQTRKVDAPSPSAGRARSSNRPRFVRAARNVRSVASSAS